MNSNPLLLLAFTAFFASFALASGQQGLDYCEVSQTCVISDFVNYRNGSPVNSSACCNVSVFQLNGTSIINFTTYGTPMSFNYYGQHNASFVLNATGYYPAKIACNCSGEYNFEGADKLVVNSSEININLSGINVSAAAMTPEQNATLYNAMNFSNFTANKSVDILNVSNATYEQSVDILNVSNATYEQSVIIREQTDNAPITAVLTFLALAFLFFWMSKNLEVGSLTQVLRTCAVALSILFGGIAIFVPIVLAGGSNGLSLLLLEGYNVMQYLFLAVIGALFLLIVANPILELVSKLRNREG